MASKITPPSVPFPEIGSGRTGGNKKSKTPTGKSTAEVDSDLVDVAGRLFEAGGVERCVWNMLLHYNADRRSKPRDLDVVKSSYKHAASLWALEKKKVGEQLLVKFSRAQVDVVGDCFEQLGYALRLNTRKQVMEFCQSHLPDDATALKPTDNPFEYMNDALANKVFFDVARSCDYVNSFKPASDDTDVTKPVKIGLDKWNMSLPVIAAQNSVDPFLEWLGSLPKWDKKKRIKVMLGELFVSDCPELLLEYAIKSVLLGVVIRAYNPGAKHDLVVILVGKQGMGKSTFFRELLPDPEYFGDSLNFAADDGRKIEQLLGNVLVESSELRGVNRGEIENMKAFISRQVDEHRMAYARRKERIPRRVIIVGTSNEMTCLPSDPSGNRRFLPIDVTPKPGDDTPATIIEFMAEHRDQLWAEALHLFKSGATVIPDQNIIEMQRAQTDDHIYLDEVLEDLVEVALMGQPAEFKLGDIIKSINETKDYAPFRQTQITHALRRRGYISRRKRNAMTGERESIWMREETKSTK